MEYRHLFQPLTVNGMQLRNRICMTAIHLNYCAGTAGRPTEQFKQFYFARAEGGAALITAGGCRFSPEGAVGHGFISLEDDSYIEPWKDFTKEMHQRGVKVAVQLYHAGRYARQARMPARMTAWAPSAVYSSYTRETAKEMTLEEIHMTIQRATAAARRARAAEFDAVEILASAGYLVTQFLSPLTNQRNDLYGGSFENRCRFPRELLASIRREVGPDYPILVRMAGNDFVPGSNTNVEAVQFAKMYEEYGADMLSVTGGWHETRVPQLPGEVPHGGFAYLARAIKTAVSIPVVVSNRIQNPCLAEELLAMEQADCVGMSRTLLADPEWPNKVQTHREQEIRPCVGCNQGCLSATFFNRPVQCAINGLCGREGTISFAATQRAKRLLTIGGGPAGMEFALRAAERGHQVTLWEQADRLGGQLQLAAVPPGKEDFRTLIRYYQYALDKAGVIVRLNQTADVQSVLGSGFNEIVLATGARPKLIPIKNPGNIPVVTGFDVLKGNVVPGRDVIIIGGGAVGCETAQFLARRGAIDRKGLFFLAVHRAESSEFLDALLHKSWRQISIVECSTKIGSGFDAGCAWPIMKDLHRLSVEQYTNAALMTTTKHDVTVQYMDENNSVQEKKIPCDTIVLCAGSLPEYSLYEPVKKSGLTVHLLGDGLKIGRVMDAIYQAMNLAVVI